MRRGKVELATSRAIRATPLTPSDEAAMELARLYARQLDRDAEKWLPQVGRQFVETLAQLGMTPKARTGIVQVAKQEADPLDELRKRRDERTG